MSGALNKLIKPDDMLLGIVSGWVSTANGPHAVESDILWGWCCIGAECINSQILVWCRHTNIGICISNTAVHVWHVITESLDWAGHLIGEVSLGEDENTMRVSNGAVGVDVVIVDIGIDADIGASWNELVRIAQVIIENWPAGKVILTAVT